MLNDFSMCSNKIDLGFFPMGWQLYHFQDAQCSQLESVVPWSLEGHAVKPYTLWDKPCMLPDILFHPADDRDYKCLFCDKQNVILLFSSLNLKHSASCSDSSSLPYYFTSFLLFTWPLQKKKEPCIVNSLPAMRSNIYRALSTTLFITINVSSPLHPLHTFITLVEMSNVFATVITPWWPWGFGRRSITKDITLFLLGALCCTAEYLNQWCLNIHAIFTNLSIELLPHL